MPSAEEVLAGLMSKAKQFDLTTSSLKMILYGDSGAGKTKAAVHIAQAITPANKKIMYLDTAQGRVTLRNHPELVNKRLIQAGIETKDELEVLGEAIVRNYKGLGSIGTVIVDEYSSLSTSDLDAVTKSRAESDARKDPDTPTQPDYNTSGNRMRKSIAELVRADHVNLILICHVRRDKDDRQIEIVSPDLLPKLSKRIREKLHLVAYMQADEVKTEEGEVDYRRTFQVHPGRRVVAKTRIGGLEPVVSFNTLAKRLKEWCNSQDPEITDDVTTVEHDDEVATSDNQNDNDEIVEGIEV